MRSILSCRLTTLISCLVLLAFALNGCSDTGSGKTKNNTNGGNDGLVWGVDAAGTDSNVPPASCQSDADCPVDKAFCAPSGFCFACLNDSHCGEGLCSSGFCVPATCTPGERMCQENTSLTCNATGDGWDKFECSGSICQDGECTGCTPSKRVCEGKTVLECAADGSGYTEVMQCSPDENCLNGDCITCYPGAKRCNGNLVETCNDAGEYALSEDCGAQGMNCTLGTCVSACFSDIKSQSNSGCDYWAIDLDNHYIAADGPFAVVVANLSEKPSEVTVEQKTGESAATQVVETETVAPGDLRIINLPAKNMNLPGHHWTAYRIQSTAPIVAYQFNPLENVDVYSNDASLLIPANTFGMEYYAISHYQFTGGGPQIPFLGDCGSICGEIPGGECQLDPLSFSEVCLIPYRGFISVLAIQPDTKVTVRPTIQTLGANGMNTMQAGIAYDYFLQPFQVLNIQSDQDLGDLTGTKITSDKPIAVFSGHMAAISNPTSPEAKCCADHLEQQLFPTNTWGKSFVATKSYTRNLEKDYWRVLASKDITQVSFDPPVHGIVTLNEGEFFEFSSKEDFTIVSNQPVSVAQILASSGEINGPLATATTCSGPGGQCASGHVCKCQTGFDCYCEPMGDPALILAAPVGQFREEYVFLSPNKYLKDYINIIAPVGAAVTLDGTNVGPANFEMIGNTGYMVARLEVSDGVHSIKSDKKVGVIAYGYDDDVSYGYTAGMNLQDL